jgi:hypothetical protein
LREFRYADLRLISLLTLMVRRRSCAVSNHEARGPSFETPASQAPQDEDFFLSPRQVEDALGDDA